LFGKPEGVGSDKIDEDGGRSVLEVLEGEVWVLARASGSPLFVLFFLLPDSML
jgi:hypothetical protein